MKQGEFALEGGEGESNFLKSLPQHIRELGYNCNIKELLFVEAFSSGMYPSATDALISFTEEPDRTKATRQASYLKKQPQVIELLRAIKDYHLGSNILSRTELALKYSSIIRGEERLFKPNNYGVETNGLNSVLKAGSLLSTLMGWDRQEESGVEINVVIPDIQENNKEKEEKEDEWLNP